MKEICNPAYISMDQADFSAEEIVDTIVTDPKDTMIRNGHCSLLIPFETFRNINSLSPQQKLSVRAKVLKAIEDSSQVIVASKT